MVPTHLLPPPSPLPPPPLSPSVEEDPPGVGGDKGVAAVRSKWELVDYGDDSDEEETRSGL